MLDWSFSHNFLFYLFFYYFAVEIFCRLYPVATSHKLHYVCSSFMNLLHNAMHSACWKHNHKGNAMRSKPQIATSGSWTEKKNSNYLRFSHGRLTHTWCFTQAHPMCILGNCVYLFNVVYFMVFSFAFLVLFIFIFYRTTHLTNFDRCHNNLSSYAFAVFFFIIIYCFI